MFKIKAPNPLYNGVTEGVPFSHGIGITYDENTRNVLVNDYGYEENGLSDNDKINGKTVKELSDTSEQQKSETEATEELSLEEMTVPHLKERAKQLDLSNYSGLTKDELIEKIENA